jgi:hypothetical protein
MMFKPPAMMLEGRKPRSHIGLSHPLFTPPVTILLQAFFMIDRKGENKWRSLEQKCPYVCSSSWSSTHWGP